MCILPRVKWIIHRTVACLSGSKNIMAESGFLSVTEAAPELGMTRQGVFYHVAQGLIKATKVGSTYVIPEKEVTRVRKERIRDLERQTTYLRGRER